MRFGPRDTPCAADKDILIRRIEGARFRQSRAFKFGGMAKTNPFQFVQQVRSEVAKVTWPSRRETMITTAMVFVMVALASIFFFVADQILSWGVGLLLGTAA